MKAAGEFGVIERYFRPLTSGRPEALALMDDGAVLAVPVGRELIITSDTLNAGVHFPLDETPAHIAHKALRVNLSDLAAMGADLLCYQLCLSFPAPPNDDFLSAFTDALMRDNALFNVFCSGGDTTSTRGHFSVTITAFGTVPAGKSIKRAGARAGDLIIVTDPIGGAMAGLKMIQDNLPADDDCLAAFRMPIPRTNISPLLRDHASAAADISDGLAADLGHIARASDLRAVVNFEHIPLLPAVANFLKDGQLTPADIVSGGDDYEIICAVPPAKADAFLEACSEAGVNAAIIGHFEHGPPGVDIFQDGQKLDLKKTGWTHF